MLLSVFFSASFIAFADHGQIETRLEGTTLCLGPRSVQAEVTRPEGAGQVVFARELREQLRATLSRADVRYERGACEGQRAAVRLSLDARYLDPETYLGFPENAHTYVVTAQVGTLTGASDIEQPLYGVTTSDIVSGPEVDAQLLGVADTVMSDLVRAWRQANVVPWVHYLIFAGLGLLLLVARAVLKLVF